jgi:hypothetical protein
MANSEIIGAGQSIRIALPPEYIAKINGTYQYTNKELIVKHFGEIHDLLSSIYRLSNTRKLKKSKLRQDVRYLREYFINQILLLEKRPAQNTVEICHTAPNSAMLQGLKPHAGNTGTSA